MGKNRKGARARGRKATGTGSSTEKDFKHGIYHRGDGFTFLSDEIVRREFTPDLCDGELIVLLILNRHAWDCRNLVVQAAASYITLQMRPVHDPGALPRDKKGKRVVPGERTIERYLFSLKRRGYIRLHKKGNEENGNEWFVEPVFIWPSKWNELAGIELASCIQAGSGDFPNIWIERWYRQTGGTEGGTAKLAVQYRQIDGTGDASSGTRYRQIGGDPRSRSSDPTAHRVSAPKPSESGAHGKRSKRTKRSPAGQDQKKQKGARVPAGVFNTANLPLGEVSKHCAKVRKNKKAEQKRHQELLAQARRLKLQEAT